MSDSLLRPPPSVGLSYSKLASSLTEQDDIQLVAASKQGDQEAFAQLVQRHQRRVFNLVYRIVQDYEEANEITQEAFFAAWQGLSSFRGDALFSTWLYRIAYNCAMKQIEHRKRDHTLQAALHAEYSATAGQPEHIDAQLEARARQTIIHEQLAKLPAKYRIVLVLRHLQDMTYEEMAHILTMPIGTIKTHLFRARNLLKERLESSEREMKSRTKGN